MLLRFWFHGGSQRMLRFFLCGEASGCFAFIALKGENSKPLSLQERGLERGFPHPVMSHVYQGFRRFQKASKGLV